MIDKKLILNIFKCILKNPDTFKEFTRLRDPFTDEIEGEKGMKFIDETIETATFIEKMRPLYEKMDDIAIETEFTKYMHQNLCKYFESRNIEEVKEYLEDCLENVTGTRKDIPESERIIKEWLQIAEQFERENS